jgi:hypothetical protein
MPERADGFGDSTLELAQCAQINFTNIENLAPVLTTNPIWRLAMEQLNAVVHRMECDEV